MVVGFINPPLKCSELFNLFSVSISLCVRPRPDKYIIVWPTVVGDPLNITLLFVFKFRYFTAFFVDTPKLQLSLLVVI